MRNLLFGIILTFCFYPFQDVAADNPLLSPAGTPYNAPRFDLVKPEHFEEAFAVAMKINRMELDSILSVPFERITFENTVIPLGLDGELYSMVSAVFSTLKRNLNTPQLSAVSKKLAPVLSNFSDETRFDERVFSRISALHDRKDSLGLDSLQIRTLDKLYTGYVRGGALCTPQQKDSLRILNAKIASARLLHGENIVNQTDSYILFVGDRDSLAGLSGSMLDAARARAAKAGREGIWAFTLAPSQYGQFMQSADCRGLREKLYTAYVTRCSRDDAYDNRQLSIDLANMRLQRARILGYRCYADYIIENNMARTADNVRDLLVALANPAIAKAKEELAEIEGLAKSIEGDDFVLMGWDLPYYSRLLRREKYDTEDKDMRPYLSMENALNGAFYTMGRLYGVKAVRRSDIPVWHTDVMTYEMLDADSSALGLLYIDPYARPGKKGGAWCTIMRSYRIRNGREVLPLVRISVNITKPHDDKPALLGVSEVKTIFHEMGHALADFFFRGPYPSVTGRFPRDMVELPSQIMEHWAREPQVLKVFARHYRTGEAIPDSLIAVMKATELYSQGRTTSKHVAAALLDLEWHSITEPFTGTVEEFEAEFTDKYGFIPLLVPRYRTPYFNHIFSGAYPSQYYAYTWASVLDTDAFAAFSQTGDIFDKGTAEAFRKYILTEVGYDEPMKQYERFRGSLPGVEALLRRKGFLP